MCDGPDRCTRQPVYTATIHRMDMCNKPPGTTAVYRFCPACMRSQAQKLEGIITDYTPVKCVTCGRSIVSLRDVLTVEWADERSTA